MDKIDFLIHYYKRLEVNTADLSKSIFYSYYILELKELKRGLQFWNIIYSLDKEENKGKTFKYTRYERLTTNNV